MKKALLAIAVLVTAASGYVQAGESQVFDSNTPPHEISYYKDVEPEYVITLGVSDPVDDLAWGLEYTMGVIFKKVVEAETAGKIQVEVFPLFQLGQMMQQIEAVMAGEQTAMTGTGGLPSFYPPWQVFSIPFLFPNVEIASDVMNYSDFARKLYDDFRVKTGARVLSMSQNGFRHFTNNKRVIKTPDDLAGLKFRIMQGPIYQKVVEALGGSAIPIPWSELYMSLSTGVVDGQENAISAIKMGSFDEVQKYITLDGHLWAENYNRIKTDIFDFSEVTQRTWHIWDTRGRNTWYGSFTAILPFGVEYGLKITNVNGLGVLGPRADNGWNTYAVNYEFWNQIKGGSPGSSNPSTSSESDDSSARQDSGGSSARQDSGGSSATISAASNIPSPVSTSTATEAATSAVAAAQASGSGTAIANIDNPSEISLAALQAMAAAAGDTPLKLQADSMNGKAVDVRITLDPSRATQGLDLSASTTNASAISSTNLFERFFQNNVMTVALGQQGSFGQPVEIAAKIDPALNMQNLAFYAYDPKANRYARIATPAYWIDQNGYVHFTTELAGHIIISDGELARK